MTETVNLKQVDSVNTIQRCSLNENLEFKKSCHLPKSIWKDIVLICGSPNENLDVKRNFHLPQSLWKGIAWSLVW